MSAGWKSIYESVEEDAAQFVVPEEVVFGEFDKSLILKENTKTRESTTHQEY